MVDRSDSTALRTLLTDAESGVLLFGITPPRLSAAPERIREITAATLARLDFLDVDGLALYDIDDESDRNPAERPFPYLPTIDPATYHAEYLAGWNRPAVVYRCVGKYTEAQLRSWLRTADPDRVLTVFVGASSKDKAVRTGLAEAQALHRDVRPDLLLGGVAITERPEEHLRLITKQQAGCAYFISQVIYSADAAKSMASDYYYTCRERQLEPKPVLFTLSVCGSVKTLAFLKWLGVHVPRWLENSLRHADDTLAESYEHCLTNARDLIAFCRKLGLPFGFLVESVSIRKAEIEASVALAGELSGLLGRGKPSA
ncbi:methylenetetrahydrofolate reductase [Amycolatopsis sp. FDAARGOS 1241]|uniref:methylenetetrahydrofolate reductase n=1 Tax=Amycolatopsis sp. FDAARGOS 1241 TaxID=2778070 RepID=UPI00194EDEFD|nr:5,10-methylenetetrahydrofolate reductase [Amycolatopsis sp. FDAARGOS 1241]QRP50426.1 5,10-methylenetetrahydrofolate reductase [Amycolatopsis sp. FDAARGOS 1241]